MAVLVLADHDQGLLSASTPRVVAAAAALGPVDVLVAGQGVEAIAAEAATLAGVARVRVADDAAYADGDAGALVTLLNELGKGAFGLVYKVMGKGEGGGGGTMS